MQLAPQWSRKLRGDGIQSCDQGSRKNLQERLGLEVAVGEGIGVKFNLPEFQSRLPGEPGDFVLVEQKDVSVAVWGKRTCPKTLF